MSVMQVFFRTGTRVPPDEARRKVALMMDGVQPDLMAAVMNYEACSKKTITGFPAVHFASSRDGFSMIGFNENGKAALMDITPLIHQALSKDSGDIVQIDRSTLEVTAEGRPYSLQYRVSRMVVQKKARHLTAMHDSEAGKDHVEKLFMASLRRQAEALGIELPAKSSVEFLGAQGTFTTKNSEGGHYCLGLKNAVFSVNLRLGGMWAVGYLLSKGYGHFNATFQLGGEAGQ